MYRANRSIATLGVISWLLACSSGPSNVAPGGGLSGGATSASTSAGASAVGGATASGASGGINGGGGNSNAVPTSGGANLGGIAATGGSPTTGGNVSTGGAQTTASTVASGGADVVGGSVSIGGASNKPALGGTSSIGGTNWTGGTSALGGTATSSTPTSGTSVGTTEQHPFPQRVLGNYCIYPKNTKDADVVAAYQDWQNAVVTADGAGGYQRVKKPDSGSVIGSTVSEGIGYGMLLAVYMGDQSLFDNLWQYEQSHLDASGLMNWEIGPDNVMTSGGAGAATDGDEDMAWALVMADRQWGGRGGLTDTYLNYAKSLINLIWTYEVDHNRGEMLKPGDQWGDVDVTNPSYFAPAYYRVFGQVTGKPQDWNKVIDSSYSIIAASLNAASGNQNNGLVPAWCNSSGTPVVAFSGAPTNFQNDSTRTPFRVGQDYCYCGESRAHDYLAKIMSFYAVVGVANIVNGYDLNGTPHPDKDYQGLQAASFVGPAGVAAMSNAQYQQFLDDAYTEVATLKLTAGTIYYQKSWTALSLLMMTANLVPF